jgi:hypothetical protein
MDLWNDLKATCPATGTAPEDRPHRSSNRDEDKPEGIHCSQPDGVYPKARDLRCGGPPLWISNLE